MFESLLRWLEPVTSHPAVQSVLSHHFLCGIILGILAAYLLRLLVWLCCRKRYCSHILVPGTSGDVTISAGAVSSVIIHGSAALQCLEIRRIKISKIPEGYRISIKAVLDAASGTAPQLLDKLTGIVKEQMSTVFGINDVCKVDLEIVNCDHYAPMDQSDEQDPELIDADDDHKFFHSAGHGDRTISLKFHGQPSNQPENKA